MMEYRLALAFALATVSQMSQFRALWWTVGSNPRRDSRYRPGAIFDVADELGLLAMEVVQHLAELASRQHGMQVLQQHGFDFVQHRPALRGPELPALPGLHLERLSFNGKEPCDELDELRGGMIAAAPFDS